MPFTSEIVGSMGKYFFRCDFLLLMDANEWISFECSDGGTCTPNIRNSCTRSHASEGENRT